MALFQKSVLANHINSIAEREIVNGWEKFQDYKSISENIRNYKEEEFQYKFLEMLFVDCFGYKISDVGNEKRNLFTEVKNVSDSKKADGAIKKDDEVIAVIELKSTKTKDFKAIQEQAFGYKVNQPKCKYVITSNFEKLRFYVNDATEFEEFDLFNLNQKDFKLLHVCLHVDNIFNDIPEKLKKDSVFEEENITKKLYEDYSSFRKEVFNSMVENNPEYNKLLLFNKTQKLLDRFLFIFFAEDRNLVPANSISKIIKKWESDIAFGDRRSLYSIFKQYFHVLNVGRPAKGEYESIFAYNGGLFSEDKILDSIKIDDKILLKHTKNLSHYDFESDVSVNVLGHIFEHSLSEIEEIQNEISGLETTTSKRKKDGVFYTPQYITKYIVENTLGKLCEEKKIELDINEETYAPSNKRSRERIKALENYRNWLLGLTICDPACGSGAFLNQALNFLIEEHKYIDELSASYNKDSLLLSDVKSSILENNLFGVDINEESVEIAKLSLWLRTAEKGRKLTSLNSNLKCGDSLIDDPEIVGDKAFNWKNEFPEIFNKGGFDIIIGNPPYVIVFDSENKNELENNYPVFQRNNDLYTAFYQKSIELLKNNGVLGFITPNSFIKGAYFQKLREFFVKFQIISVVDFTNFLVFEDANVFSAIMILSKNKGKKDWYLYSDLGKLKGVIKNGSLSFIPENEIQKKLNHLESFDKYFLIKDVGFNYWSVGRGKVRGDSVGSRILYNGVMSNEKDIAYVKGSNFNKYTGIEIENYLKHNFQDYLNENDVFRYSESILETSPKLIYRQTSSKLIGTIDTHKYYCDKTVHVIVNRENENFNLKYVLAIFNSKLMNYLYALLTEEAGRVFPQVKTVNIKQLPFKVSSTDYQDSLVNLVDLALEYGDKFSKSLSKFESYLKNYYSLNELTKKLKNWGDLEFLDFIKELNKAIKKAGGNKITKNDEIDLNEAFELRKSEIKSLKTKIKKIEKQIDILVYEIYELNQKEIDIIENIIVPSA